MLHQSLTVASLNLHWGCDSGGAPYDTTEACGTLASDVICLQEVWSPGGEPSIAMKAGNELGYAVEELPLTALADISGFRVVRTESEATGSWGLAVLTRFPVTASTVIDLGRAAGDTVRRAAQMVTLELPGGTSLRVVNTHLTHRLLHGPGQLRRLFSQLPFSESTVVMGDLNMVGPLAGAVSRRRRPVRGRTWPAGRPVAQLDHALVSSDLSVLKAEVLPPLGSDHLPIRVALTVPPARRERS
ncbi:endonuclease/exonuclease/phosphatase family protein [Streptomyces sp. NPDC057521]|uniref:endonuclease/exonuclease/phosphatase family protein n=1 Tax=Streptomyces sp. NPDC057521 TaxID=3346156 RepID=UPI0036BAFA61